MREREKEKEREIEVFLSEVMHTRRSACHIDKHGVEPDLESAKKNVVIEKLYDDNLISQGYLRFPPFTEKESCSTDHYDMVF